MSTDELKQVEEYVNSIINNGYEVNTRVLAIEDAKKEGAMALFGEKYGDTVRVVSVDMDEFDGKDFLKGSLSKEFCGGTHVKNTAQIGSFKIISENSVASGVRRISAVTGNGLLQLLNKYQDISEKSAQVLKLKNVFELPEKCEKMQEEFKTLSKQVEKDLELGVTSKIDELLKLATEKDGMLFLSLNMGGMNGDALRVFGDKLKDKAPNIVALLAGTYEGKGVLLAVCGKDAVKSGYNAGKIVRTAAELTGGKGGGRPDSAMAGVGDIALIDKALSAIK
jgi:alanyl-tRNA synthetase